jgi:hypothetical protein
VIIEQDRQSSMEGPNFVDIDQIQTIAPFGIILEQPAINLPQGIRHDPLLALISGLLLQLPRRRHHHLELLLTILLDLQVYGHLLKSEDIFEDFPQNDVVLGDVDCEFSGLVVGVVPENKAKGSFFAVQGQVHKGLQVAVEVKEGQASF